MKWSEDFVLQAKMKNHVIVGFNVFGYEDAQAVIRAAERVNCPVLLMVNHDARKVLDLAHWAALLGSLAQTASVPVGVHLDHCSDLATIGRAIDLGFDSVMYDGSKLPLAANMENTAEVCNWAHKAGVRVEAELGTVPYDELGETESRLTSASEAKLLCMQTGADWLAVSVGNVHRLLGRKAHINFAALREIEAACPSPLVIHGASGLFEEDLLALCNTHVGKINIGTALRRVFGQALRREVTGRPDMYDRLALLHEPSIQVEKTAYRILSAYYKTSTCRRAYI